MSIVSITCAQTTEGYFYSAPVNTVGSSCSKILDAGNGSFYIIGTGDSSCVQVIKCDSAFNILSDKRYTSNELMLVGDAIVTSDKGLLIAGLQVLNLSGSQRHIPQVFKLDSLGNIEWAYNESVNYFGQYNSCFQFSDSVYFIGGSFSSSTGEAPYYVAISSDGATLWGQRLDTLDGYPAGIVFCADGGYAMLVSTGCIVKFDSLHNPLWKSFIDYNIPNTSLWYMKMIPTSDGGFASVGMRVNTYTDCIVAKVDSSGQLLWNLIFDVAGGETFYDLVEDSVGGLFVVGGTDFSGFGSSCALTAKIDSDGEPEWFRAGKDTCNLRTVRLLDDGRYQVAGNNNGKIYISTFDQSGYNCSYSRDTGNVSTSSLHTGKYSTFVDSISYTRTANGNVFPGSFYYTDMCLLQTSSEDLVDIYNNVDVIPNPAVNAISFNLQIANARIQIADPMGNVVLDEISNGEKGMKITLSVALLKSSIYILRQLDNTNVFVAKFIKL